MRAPIHHRVQLILAITAMLWLLIFMGARAFAAPAVTIMTDGGGPVLEYVARARQYAKDGTRVRIIGSCASACTAYLSMPRDQLCVSATAWLGFHKARSLRPEPEAVRQSYDDLLWSSYPVPIKARLGRLHRGLIWLRGAQILGAVRECEQKE